MIFSSLRFMLCLVFCPFTFLLRDSVAATATASDIQVFFSRHFLWFLLLVLSLDLRA